MKMLQILFVAFLLLKLLGLLAVSWWIVFLPLILHVLLNLPEAIEKAKRA